MAAIGTWIRHARSERDSLEADPNGERQRLARGVRRALGGAGADRLPGAAPLNRIAVRRHSAELSALAERLDDLDQPMAPGGIALVRDLVADGGPLYGGPATDLPELLFRIHLTQEAN